LPLHIRLASYRDERGTSRDFLNIHGAPLLWVTQSHTLDFYSFFGTFAIGDPVQFA
jgi:hypothetical protein